MMYFRALMLSGCVALAGCQTTHVSEQVQQALQPSVSNVTDLQAAQMKLPSSAVVAVTPNSQVLNYQQINSPVAVFDLPADRGEFSLTITSNIGDTAFVPSAVILDESGKVIEQYSSDQFVYTKPRLHLGNRLVLDTDFFPPKGSDKVTLVVYTDAANLGGYTEIIHPARLDAEARGNYLPEVEDIKVPNGLEGDIEVDISRVRFFTFGGSSTETNTKPQQATQEVLIHPDTEAYYHNAIASAVKVNDLPKALSLLDEAKALGVRGAQETFVKAVNSNKS